MIAGLGNPGADYAGTRHNAGFMTADFLSRRHQIKLDQNRFDAHFGTGRILDHHVIVAKPMTFMNRSGPSIECIARFYDMPCRRIIVIHDDIDLSVGTLRVKKQGGHGGHNGLKSIIESMRCDKFIRVRIGIGRGPGPVEITDHVLGNFQLPETETLTKAVIPCACEAIMTILTHGVDKAMNIYNRKQACPSDLP